MYDGYCLDTDGPAVSGTAHVYSIFEPFLEIVRIENRKNPDMVNWIVNQDFVGKMSVCGDAYTYGDVQWVIWQLLENTPPVTHVSLGQWSLCRAQEILAAAQTYGVGFMPTCGHAMGIILVMEPYWWQPVLIWAPVPCTQDETVWACDYFGNPLELPGANWAMYFKYVVQ